MQHYLYLLAAIGLAASSQVNAARVGGKVSPDGKTEIQIDLPANLQTKNVGGSDGAGLCVFTSVGHAARWQSVLALEDFQAWMKRYPGGGWPEKLDQMIDRICREKGLPKPDYIQVQGGREILPIIQAAASTGRMPCVTYSRSPTGRYNGKPIAHMVNLAHADAAQVAVLDNNYLTPTDNAFEWMSIDQFLRTFTGGRSGWAVILLAPPPPPFPYTKGA